MITTKRRSNRSTRADKARRIRSVIRVYWRTLSDRQMAGKADCTHRTIASHRQKMEDAGEIGTRTGDCRLQAVVEGREGLKMIDHPIERPGDRGERHRANERCQE